MPSPDPTWTDVFQTVFIGLQLVLLLIAALFARSQLKEARELREEQIRPFVVIDLDSTKKPFFDLVVKNIGTTMARNVEFHFDPAPQSTMSHAAPERLKMFSDGIATLPPGKEIRTLFDSGIKRYKSDLPDIYSVKVTYQDQVASRQFEESMHLDFGLYWNRLSVTRYDIHDIYKQLETMAREIAKWTASPGGGILHQTPADTERRNRKIGEQLESPWWKPGDSEDKT